MSKYVILLDDTKCPTIAYHVSQEEGVAASTGDLQTPVARKTLVYPCWHRTSLTTEVRVSYKRTILVSSELQ